MGFMGQHLCRFRTTFVDTAVSKTSRIKGVTKRRQSRVLTCYNSMSFFAIGKATSGGI